jgi:hypothetical protein
VSVVVVVTGPGIAGCVVCDDVVVVLPDGVDAHADNAAIAMANRLGTINFFMVMFPVLLVFALPLIIPRRARGDYGV